MFVQSFCPYTRKIKGINIPKHKYSEFEMQRGAKNIVEVNDAQLEELQKDKTFKSLLESKKYRILDTLPASYKAHEELLKEKNDELSKKQEEIDNLKKQLAEKEKNLNRPDGMKEPVKPKGKGKK